MSSTADARRDAPVRPALTPREPAALHARVRVPRPWTASLQRPAAKILVAGGLTFAGWLLGAALSGSTASAADRPVCPEAPAVSTVDHAAADHAAKPFWHARHRRSHHETGDATCALQPKTDSAGSRAADEPPAGEPRPQADQTTKDSSPAGAPAATSSESTSTDEPAATPDSSSTDEPTATPDGSSTDEPTATPDSVSATEPTAAAPESSPTGEPAATSAESSSTDEPATTKAASSDSSPAEAPQATSSSGNLLGGLVGSTLKTVTGATTTDSAEAPTKATSSGGDLLGGLVGSILEVVGGTLSTVTDTLGAVTYTLSHTVLAPLTQPPAGHPGAAVLLPLDDILAPVLGGSSNSGGVTATVPGVTVVVTQAPATETGPTAVPTITTTPQTSRVAVTHFVVRHAKPLPPVHEQPRDSGTHATGGGGDSTPGLPGGTTAPSAPAPTAAPGHDGSGGARHAFAVHTDDVTTTQLKLIGTSRDHEVDGAGRDAALPTTSPD
ncbi:hypothetical protein [Amycolatopsis sp. lyj-346]|uniref:hypothetical protein n=1 Tax=Amycolatopsis sp. lyj-346 TaxID=2789289 RepID=UPI00397A9AD2